MELEFDKEIDSLLRKTGEAERGVLVADTPGGKPDVHLDADQLSAFAENAIPERSRGLYMSHLADCDRCRRILSGMIALNTEAEPAEERLVAPVIVPVIAAEPWYKRLLLPNLAYVMGGLVLIFGGLITFSLLQSSMTGESTVSRSMSNATSQARGPMEHVTNDLESAEMQSNSNAAALAANKPLLNANSSANATVASNSAPSGATVGELKDRDAAPADDRAGLAPDGLAAAKPAAEAPAPAPPPAAKNETKEAITTLTDSAREERIRDAEKRKISEDQKADALAAKQGQDVARSQAGGLAKSTPGPSRNAQQNFPNRADNTYEMYEEKRVSGKTFQHRDNVWYDRAYRGQATTNVRRNTEDYRKLDSGLRSIAESLSGVVVVVWKDRAYRIQ